MSKSKQKANGQRTKMQNMKNKDQNKVKLIIDQVTKKQTKLVGYKQKKRVNSVREKR